MLVDYRVILLLLLYLLNVKSLQTDSDQKVIAFDDLASTTDIFSDVGVAYFSQLLFDVTREQLVVGARDTIYRLTIDDLQIQQKTIWSAAPDKIASCLEKGQSEEDCRNYVKVLLSDGAKLFTCGTNAFSPWCSWRELQDTDKVNSWTDGLAKCPYNPHANITSLMSEKDVYFAGTAVDFTGTDSAIIKHFGGPFIRTTQFDSKSLNEPQFVGSFETDSFVYFLFRENAVEYMNCGKKIYSRIARVCKNDTGGTTMLRDNWTTFLKARLNCSLPGEYPFYFDEIQGITYLPDEGLVYATFNTPRNSIPGSAVCSFNLTAIYAAFDGPYKHQESINSVWEKRTLTNQNHKQCRHTDPRNLIDSSKYQLMDNAVQPVVQVPLYYSQLETIVHIAVDVIPTKLHREMHIMFVSTEDNIIKKISILPRTMQTCVLEVWKPLSNPNDGILSMHFLKQTDSLYIGTKNAVIRILSQHCKRHKSKQACSDAMDPYCGWNELKEQCSPAPEKNPLIPYWHQNVNSCPTFMHPVPGGWSEWSAWSPCNQANSNGDSADQCRCSSRQCNNPPPKNGGAFCDGVSIQVANCTRHGEWTNWSEWSACSQSCGIAVKTRKRTCSNPAPAFGGRVCVGMDTQEIYCIGNPPCPEPNTPDRDGRWSAWSTWSECSAKCSRGFRVRSRKCDNPPPQKPGGLDCQGCNLDYEICNDFPCPETKRLSGWTPWQSVLNGSEKRYRFSCKAPVNDVSLIKITLAKEEDRVCQPDGLCYRSGRSDPEDSWSEWSPWSPCSADCDGGVQYKTRNCEMRNEDCVGSPRMTKACNTHACKGEWSCWTDWSPCSVNCGVGIKQRSRVCLSSSNRSLETNNCVGSTISQERCEMPPCPTKGWSSWSNWSECDEQNQQYRTRKCSISNPSSSVCRGSDKELKPCDDSSNVLDTSNALGVQSGQLGEPPSTFTLIIFCCLAFAAGLGISSASCYYWMKKHQHSLPSSPHYISKQNPYVTVPLKEVPTPKRTPSFSKNSLSSNGAPKLFSKTTPDYETATIKRNSHSLLTGHARTPTLEQDRFF